MVSGCLQGPLVCLYWAVWLLKITLSTEADCWTSRVLSFFSCSLVWVILLMSTRLQSFKYCSFTFFFFSTKHSLDINFVNLEIATNLLLQQTGGAVDFLSLQDSQNCSNEEIWDEISLLNSSDSLWWGSQAKNVGNQCFKVQQWYTGQVWVTVWKLRVDPL